MLITEHFQALCLMTINFLNAMLFMRLLLGEILNSKRQIRVLCIDAQVNEIIKIIQQSFFELKLLAPTKFLVR